MNLVVSGPRRWLGGATFVRNQLDEERRDNGLQLFVGCATGVDELAWSWACNYAGVPVRRFVADWSAFGKAAGVRRSARMLDNAGCVSRLVAFVNAGVAISKGTAHTIRMAHGRGMAILVVCPDGRLWRTPPTEADMKAWTYALDVLHDKFGPALKNPLTRDILGLFQQGGKK